MNEWYLTAGDFGFFWEGQIRSLSWLPQVYRTDIGWGVPQLVILWFSYPYSLVLKMLDSIGLSWWGIEKLIWLSVFILGVYSSYRLAEYILKTRLSSLVASIVYLANTYFLLLFGGRQVGVALAYAFSPFVLLCFIKSADVKKQTYKNAILNGLWLALLVVFDLRLAYIVLGAIVLYHLFSKKFHFVNFVVSVGIAMLIHAFWILPTVLSRTGPAVMGEDFINPGMLKFLSVADFSHAISLLHPNWPENLFGKVYFLQPEFLIVPLIAFITLLFLRQMKNKQHILYFALLVLFGAFLAKGVNPPAGGIFQWMFQYVPGFILFRDPTKFYVLTAIGYSILIPFALLQIVTRLKRKAFIVYILFGIFWILTIRAAFTGESRGNFHLMQLPEEYVLLKDQLVQDGEPSRTLWIPSKGNFAYYSDIHPVLQMDQVFKGISLSEIPVIATGSAFQVVLSGAGVKYVVVPMDTEEKFFMSDYMYDDQMRQRVISALQQTPLKKLEHFKKIAVFENPQFQGMNRTVPVTVSMQQHYANVGVVISVVVLIGAIILIVWL